MISSFLLAAADGWIGFVVFLVIMIISAVSQMAGNKKPPEQRPQPRPRPPVRPAQAGAAPQRPVAQRQGPVAQELEEFLRRAAGGQQPARRQPQPTPPAQRAPRPVVAQPVLAQPVLAEVTDELEVVETLADHMSHSVAGLPSQFEHREDQTDRLGSGFDRQMGGFDSDSTRTAPAAALAEPGTGAEDLLEAMPPTAAAGLAAMLASPTSLKQAILISEILNRPEHRWS